MATQDELLGQMSAVQQAPQSREISSDFLHNMTDIGSMKLSLRVKWGGWQVLEKAIINKGLGIEEKSFERSILIYDDKRDDKGKLLDGHAFPKLNVMNEMCCDHICEGMQPLIMRAQQMGWTNEDMLNRLFRSDVTELKWTLIFNYINGNSFEFQMDRLADVIMQCCKWIAIASKSTSGNALREVAESISSQTIGYAPMPIQAQQSQPKPGIMQRLIGGGRNG